MLREFAPGVGRTLRAFFFSSFFSFLSSFLALFFYIFIYIIASYFILIKAGGWLGRSSVCFSGAGAGARVPRLFDGRTAGRFGALLCGDGRRRAATGGGT